MRRPAPATGVVWVYVSDANQRSWRFDEKYTGVEGWVQITNNGKNNNWSHAWVETPKGQAKPKPPTGGTETAPPTGDAKPAAAALTLAVLRVPAAHRRRLRTTNGLERLNKEIKRRTRVATLVPSDPA